LQGLKASGAMEGSLTMTENKIDFRSTDQLERHLQALGVEAERGHLVPMVVIGAVSAVPSGPKKPMGSPNRQ